MVLAARPQVLSPQFRRVSFYFDSALPLSELNI